MKCPFCTPTVMLTVLALILGSWAQGFALSKPRVSELVAVVICAEGGSTEILLDARGQPVTRDDCAHSLCPDCLPVLSLSVVGVQEPMADSPMPYLAMIPAALPVLVGRAYAVPFGRGPPDLA